MEIFLYDDDAASLSALYSVKKKPKLPRKRIFKYKKIIPFKPQYRQTLEAGTRIILFVLRGKNLCEQKIPKINNIFQRIDIFY